jgi:WD40-like Beta Propeller Repeat
VASGPQGLWVINVATGAAREILSSGEDEVGASAWSPDGRWIAFDRNPSNAGLTVPPLGSSQLWVVRPDGSGLRQLTHLTGPTTPGRRPGRPTAPTRVTYRSRSNWPVATIRANTPVDSPSAAVDDHREPWAPAGSVPEANESERLDMPAQDDRRRHNTRERAPRARARAARDPSPIAMQQARSEPVTLCGGRRMTRAEFALQIRLVSNRA